MNLPTNDLVSRNRIGVLISGSGTTLKNLLFRKSQGELAADVAIVISSNAQALGLNYASDAGIAHNTVDWNECKDANDFSRRIFQLLEAHNVQWVVMGGFLKKLLIPSAFENRVVNIHPSLIPSFSGHGYYGKRVHQAVLDFGCRVSGCTVHFVDNEFDHGPIIAQHCVEVLDDDTAETLAARVFEAECNLYPSVVNQLVSRRLHVVGRQVRFS